MSFFYISLFHTTDRISTPFAHYLLFALFYEMKIEKVLSEIKNDTWLNYH